MCGGGGGGEGGRGQAWGFDFAGDFCQNAKPQDTMFRLSIPKKTYINCILCLRGNHFMEQQKKSKSPPMPPPPQDKDAFI